ncbi:MAG: arylesterase [Rhodospirillales bacterium]|jgi:acyl-CoA thioesterase-1|nr:arylesterase [Rhodospirillales bacterium]
MAFLELWASRRVRDVVAEVETVGTYFFERFAAARALAVLAVLAELAASGAPARAETVRILVLGDSLTAGYGLDLADTFPVRLERALRDEGLDVAVINAGVSGDTTAGGLARLGWALADRPDIAIVALGGNDALRGLDPTTTRANLDAIVTRIEAAGVRVLLAGMKAPPNLGAEYGRAFEAVFAGIAERHGVAFYPFFLEGVAAVAALNQDDAIHPNARGIHIMVEGIVPYVRDLIADVD